MIGAQREEGNTRGCIAPLNGMKDRGGIIHHTERIHRNGETLFLETTPNLIGKAGPHKEDRLEGSYLKVGRGDVYYCTKVHFLLLAATDL